MRKLSFILSLLLLAPATSSIFAQQTNDAVVLGRITDPSHIPISNAIVVLKQLATGSTSEVHSSDTGEYRTPPLRIGEYEVTIEAPGFKQFVQHGLVLGISDVRQLNAELSLGEIAQVVSVEASNVALNNADSTVGTVIGNKQIVELPLNGRDYMQLAALSAGTVPSTATGSQGPIGISIGGQVGYAVGFLLDGIDNNNQFIRYSYGNQKESIKPSVDAIDQFKVVTNGYSAEYGRSSSGVISVSTKSGTNQFHGSAYEFIRNEAIDAQNYFAKVKPPYKRNDFGASIGGPILRNRFFGFGDFEIIRVRQTTTQTDTVPTVAQRQGIFTNTIYDPTIYDSITKTRQPFANNTIPASRIDPIAQKVLAFYPLPQTSSATNNYVYNAPNNQNPYRYDVRLDGVASEAQRVFFRYSTQIQDYGAVSTLPPISGVYYTSAQPTRITGNAFALGYDSVWSAHLISSIRVGWNYLLSKASSQGTENINALIGFNGADTTYPGGLVSLPITGYTSLGGGGKGNIAGTQTRQISGDITWTRGKHNLKFGTQQYWLQTNFFSAQQSQGIMSFTGVYTRNPTTLANGSPFADFLLGTAATGTLSDEETIIGRQPLTHFYVLDDWTVSPKLTVNIGIRYELNRPLLDKTNSMANLDLDTDPAKPALVLAGADGDGRDSRAIQSTDWNQWAPRAGFAYSLDSKTVVRGAYGLFYSNVTTPGGMQSMQINAPFHMQISISPDPTNPSVYLHSGFPAGTLSLANAKNVLAVSHDRHGLWPRSQQWNFNIQRELPGGVLVELGYAGNSLTRAWMQYDANQAIPGPGNANNNRPYKTVAVPRTPYTVSLADIARIAKLGYSTYNAFQVKVERRYRNGISLLAAYGYSKTMALGENQSGGVQDSKDLDADRAVSSQDMTHHLVASGVFELPFGRSRKFGGDWNRYTNAVLGSWSLDPIVTINSGIPVNLSVSGNPSNSGQGSLVGNNDRPNVVGDWHLDNRTVQRWFNTSAFVANAPYTLGNAGRNILRAPGLANLDLAAHKSFQVHERLTAQLRLESFNLTNTPHFGAPNAVVGNGLFGQITSAGDPRDLQAGLKLIF